MKKGDLVTPRSQVSDLDCIAIQDIGVILEIDEVDFESVLVHWLTDKTQMWEDATRLTKINTLEEK